MIPITINKRPMIEAGYIVSWLIKKIKINAENGVKNIIFDILATSPYLKAKNQKTKPSPLEIPPNQKKAKICFDVSIGKLENIKTPKALIIVATRK